MQLDRGEIQRFLRTVRLGHQIEVVAQTESTNSDAVLLGRAGASEGAVVLADSQTKGRGRLGRRWASPSGLNLYCSVLLRPPLKPEDAPSLTLMVGVAAADAIEDAGGCRAEIKWPNDVLLDGRKVGGILAEMSIDAGRLDFVVVGIGLNVNAQSADFPPELSDSATSMSMATGRTIDRNYMAACLLNAIEGRYDSFLKDGFSSVSAVWPERDALRGRRLRVRAGAEIIEGSAAGVSENGRLRLETAEGLREIVAGDVSVLDVYTALHPEH